MLHHSHFIVPFISTAVIAKQIQETIPVPGNYRSETQAHIGRHPSKTDGAKENWRTPNPMIKSYLVTEMLFDALIRIYFVCTAYLSALSFIVLLVVKLLKMIS